MKINVEYFDSEIIIENDKIYSIEIENKKYFYRFINDLNDIINGNIKEEIKFFNSTDKEINCTNRIKLFINYFDLDIKQYNTSIQKYVFANLQDEDRDLIVKSYQKLSQIYDKILKKFDLPCYINNEENIEAIIKLLKINIHRKDTILENLLTIIDVEKELELNHLLIFVNLKQYLSKEELKELYKYAIYNEIKFLLIDSQNYGITMLNEKKTIIDKDLNEYDII